MSPDAGNIALLLKHLEQIAESLCVTRLDLLDFLTKYAQGVFSALDVKDRSLSVTSKSPAIGSLCIEVAYRQRSRNLSGVVLQIARDHQPRVRELAQVFRPSATYCPAASGDDVEIGFEYGAAESPHLVLIGATVEFGASTDLGQSYDSERFNYDDAFVARLDLRPLVAPRDTSPRRPRVGSPDQQAASPPGSGLADLLRSLAQELARQAPSAQRCARILRAKPHTVPPLEEGDERYDLQIDHPLLDEDATIGVVPETRDVVSNISLRLEEDVTLESCIGGLQEAQRGELEEELDDGEILFEVDESGQPNLVLIRFQMSDDPCDPESVVEEIVMSAHPRGQVIELP
jgi:hypothetical protein